MGKGVICSRTW